MGLNVSMKSITMGTMYDYIFGSNPSCDVIISQGLGMGFSYFCNVQGEYYWFMNDCSSTLTSLLTSILCF